MSFFHALLSAGGVNVVVSTDVPEPIEGIFEIQIVFARAVSGFTVGDITVTNGTAENLYSTDDITWTCNIIPDAIGDVQVSIAAGVVTPSNSVSNTLTVEINEEWAFLSKTSTSDIYYEFRELVSDSGVAVTTTDPSLRDLSGNVRNLSLVNAPTASHFLTVADVNTDSMGLRSTTTNCVSIGGTGSTFLGRAAGFSVVLGIRLADGQAATTQSFCGATDATNIGLIIDVLTTGVLRIRFMAFVWVSGAAVFSNGATGLHQVDAHFDFVNDVLSVNYDGGAVAGTFTSGNISSTDPTGFACTRNFLIGTHNLAAAPFSNQTNQITYFAITTLQTAPQRSAIRTYLGAREATFVLVDTITNATFIINPHDVELSADLSKAFISSKGDDTGSSTDGAFAIIDITNPASLSVLGGYNGTLDQIDGETVMVISPTRVLHFVDDNALLFDVSNPASPSKIRTVANGSGVINGAVIVGNRYIIGANKGGTIDVFDAGVALVNIDTFTLVGSYDATTDMGTGPHDVDVTDDGEHIVVVSRPQATTTHHFAIYKVVNAGSLIALASWVVLSKLNTASLVDANRVRVLRDQNTALLSCANNFATVDITTLASPAVSDTFDMTTFSSGLTRYKNRWAIPTWQVGLRLLKVTDRTDIIQDAGYYNDTTFTTGNASFHDLKTFKVSGQWYVIVTCQSSSQVAVWKINRH